MPFYLPRDTTTTGIRRVTKQQHTHSTIKLETDPNPT